MPIIHFTGFVLPGAIRVTTSNLPTIEWRESSTSQTLKFRISIVNSVVDVECELPSFTKGNDFNAALVRALDLSRAVVDCHAFAKGYGLTVHLDKVTYPDQTSDLLFFSQPHLSKFFTAFDVNSTNADPNSFDAMMRMVIGEPPVFMALNDLIVSITLPHHAPVNCARAIEGIRVLMVPPGGDRKQGWPLMRDNLNVEQSYLSFVTGHSTAGRHGDRTHIVGPTVQEIIDRSWIVMNRFLEFRKRGNVKLSLSEFPLLQ
jgi:hypothetical protein